MPESLRKGEITTCDEWGHDEKFIDTSNNGFLIYKCLRCGVKIVKENEYE